MLFPRKVRDKILAGKKTQTRRIRRFRKERYALRSIYTERAEECPWIIITRKFRQRLGDVTEEDAQKEGFANLEEFKREWERLNGRWNPDRVVWVYEFKLVK